MVIHVLNSLRFRSDSYSCCHILYSTCSRHCWKDYKGRKHVQFLQSEGKHCCYRLKLCFWQKWLGWEVVMRLCQKSNLASVLFLCSIKNTSLFYFSLLTLLLFLFRNTHTSQMCTLPLSRGRTHTDAIPRRDIFFLFSGFSSQGYRQ